MQVEEQKIDPASVKKFDMIEGGSDSVDQVERRRSENFADDDPRDINRASNFTFLQTDATEIMRRNKKKVLRYVFIDDQDPFVSKIQEEKGQEEDLSKKHNTQ